MKPFLGHFYRHLAIYAGHTGQTPKDPVLNPDNSIFSAGKTRAKKKKSEQPTTKDLLEEVAL